MAKSSAIDPTTRLDRIFQGSVSYWFITFLFLTPLVRLHEGGMDFYPFQLALGLFLGVQILEEGAWPPVLRALFPLLALSAFMVLMLAIREEWGRAVLLLGLTGLNFLWGAAAFRYGIRAKGDVTPLRAMIPLPWVFMGAGLLGWASEAWLPAACQALNCPGDAVWPYAFHGGWERPDVYLVLLIFLLPVLGSQAVMSFRESRRTAWATWVCAMLGLTGLSLVMGSPWWGWLLLGLMLVLLAIMLLPQGTRGDRLLLKSIAVFAVFSALVVYGMEPGFLWRAIGVEGPLPALRLTVDAEKPARFTSAHATRLRVGLLHTGWSGIGADPAEHPEDALWVGSQLSVRGDSGLPKVVAGVRVPLQSAMAPGEARAVDVPVRLPHWAREGYLSLRLENGRGEALPLAEGSHTGWRVTNTHFRPLEGVPDNRLSALYARARAYHAEAKQPAMQSRDRNDAMQVLGAALDTLFFSPIWGEERRAVARHAEDLGPPGLSPLNPNRPFWAALFTQYGLIGLALALWFAWRLGGTAVTLARQAGTHLDSMPWRLLPLCVVLWAASGLFTGALASYHAYWAFFVLAGFMEGRKLQGGAPARRG